MSEEWDLNRLKNEVLCTTGCKVNEVAISMIVTSYLAEVSKNRQECIVDGICWDCDGSGLVRSNYMKNGKYVFHKEKCSDCNGSGVIISTTQAGKG